LTCSSRAESAFSAISASPRAPRRARPGPRAPRRCNATGSSRASSVRTVLCRAVVGSPHRRAATRARSPRALARPGAPSARASARSPAPGDCPRARDLARFFAQRIARRLRLGHGGGRLGPSCSIRCFSHFPSWTITSSCSSSSPRTVACSAPRGRRHVGHWPSGPSRWDGLAVFLHFLELSPGGPARCAASFLHGDRHSGLCSARPASRRAVSSHPSGAPAPKRRPARPRQRRFRLCQLGDAAIQDVQISHQLGELCLLLATRRRFPCCSRSSSASSPLSFRDGRDVRVELAQLLARGQGLRQLLVNR